MDGQLTALEQHDCPACGAQAEWDPGRRELVCPYCSTVVPYERDEETGGIREIDLVATLRSMPDELRGWKTERKTVRCQSCNAVSVFDPERVGQNCDFCGSPQLVDYEELKPPIQPQSIAPFRVTIEEVRTSLRRWLASKWLAPGALERSALVDTVRGVYLPYWTFDADSHCPWTADAGHYYYETRSVTGSDGKRRTQQVRRVRWVPAAGAVEHFFDDEPVPASHGVPHALLREIEPFPVADLLPYDTAYLSGFVVEHYQVVLFDAAARARSSMVDQLRGMCAAAVPGDTYRDLVVHPSFSGQTFKHILAPVWLLRYDFGAESFQAVVNGSTGRLAGEYPKSPWKIFFLVAAALATILFVIYLGR